MLNYFLTLVNKKLLIFPKNMLSRELSVASSTPTFQSLNPQFPLSLRLLIKPNCR